LHRQRLAHGGPDKTPVAIRKPPPPAQKPESRPRRAAADPAATAYGQDFGKSNTGLGSPFCLGATAFSPKFHTLGLHSSFRDVKRRAGLDGLAAWTR